MNPARVRHLISLGEIGRDDLRRLVDRTVEHAAGKVGDRTLENRFVGIYFALTSTRTRTAFTTGSMRLGAHTVTYGPGDRKLKTGETRDDSGRVLAAMLDALVVRASGDSAELRSFASGNSLSLI